MTADRFRTKRAVREAACRAITRLPAETREKADALLAARLTALPEWSIATSLLAYLAMPDEVATDLIVRAAFEAGKRLYLPRVAGGRMTFHLVDSSDEIAQFRRHRYGMLEPPETAPRWSPARDELESAAARSRAVPEGRGHALIVCPGRAFDRTGRRLGRGGGFYDRFLSGLGTGPARGRTSIVGIAYEVQIVDEVPVAEDDVAMSIVVTERSTLRFD
ncbi:MAG: 5-formyltetrahydrofolate cyclo-ligase [Spirochaetota bacterium]